MFRAQKLSFDAARLNVFVDLILFRSDTILMCYYVLLYFLTVAARAFRRGGASRHLEHVLIKMLTAKC